MALRTVVPDVVLKVKEGEKGREGGRGGRGGREKGGSMPGVRDAS